MLPANREALPSHRGPGTDDPDIGSGIARAGLRVDRITFPRLGYKGGSTPRLWSVVAVSPALDLQAPTSVLCFMHRDLNKFYERPPRRALGPADASLIRT